MRLNDTLEQLIQSEGDLLCRFIHKLGTRKLGLSLAPQEVVNQAVVYALQNPQQFTSRSRQDLLRYLYWKTKCILLDEARHRGRTLRLGENSPEELRKHYRESGILPSPTFTMHRKAKQDVIRKFLDMIPEPQCRQAVELTFIDELQPREAAKLMGLSTGEFRNVFRRGFRFLTRVAESARVHGLLTTGTTS